MQRLLRCGLAVLALSATATLAQADECASPLFSCQTEHGDRYIAICGTEPEVADAPWTGLQYLYGKENEPAELAYPADPAQGGKLMFFSHVKRGADYRVAIRFVSGGYTYRIYSHSEPAGAGVTVSNAGGQVISTQRCGERPYMFSTYMRRSMACDLTNPHGRAACQEAPFVEKP